MSMAVLTGPNRKERSTFLHNFIYVIPGSFSSFLTGRMPCRPTVPRLLRKHSVISLRSLSTLKDAVVVRVNHKELELFATRVFEALSLSSRDASLIARSLVKCNLRGQDGHGVSRVTVYSKRLRAGIVNPRPQIKFENVSTCAALCEGDNGMGFLVATQAMDRAIELAKGSGIGMVGVKNSTHFGSSSQYVQQALDADMVSMVFTNSSPALPPWGGFQPFLGASPIAAGVPAGQEHPFLMDMSTTVIARGKLRLAAQRGEPIPPGIGLDKHGNPTTDGMEAFHGVTLPFGGYKGAAISLWMEILSGVLTGAAFGGRVSSLYNDFTSKQNVGHLMIAIKPDLFMPMEVFKDRMDDLVRRVKSQPLAKGFEEILMVGEPETRQEQKRLVQGIPLQIDVAKSLQAEGENLGVPFPFHIPV